MKVLVISGMRFPRSDRLHAECFARARDLVRRERATVQRAAAVLAAEGRAGPEPSRLELVMEGRG